MSAVRKNYTEREKCLLLSLVDQYKDVVENKCTNAITIEMKSNTWDSIACRFNASSEYPRTSKQLHTLYLNMKRITRQNIAAENINKYTEQKKLEELKQLKKDAVADKKGINATGGGSYQPLLTDAGAQMLAIIEEQVKPLTNDCDSASEYYRITAPVEVEIQEINRIEEQSKGVVAVSMTDPENSSSISLQNPNPKPQKRKVFQHLKKNKENIKPSEHIIKSKFYRKKLESAIIEKKTLIQKYKLMIKKQIKVDHEIKIKKIELDKLLNSRDEKKDR